MAKVRRTGFSTELLQEPTSITSDIWNTRKGGILQVKVTRSFPAMISSFPAMASSFPAITSSFPATPRSVFSLSSSQVPIRTCTHTFASYRLYCRRMHIYQGTNARARRRRVFMYVVLVHVSAFYWYARAEHDLVVHQEIVYFMTCLAKKLGLMTCTLTGSICPVQCHCRLATSLRGCFVI
jgi:hypothetical protein